MMKSYHIQCPKCNNDHSFYRYGKDPDGYQKYLCRTCQHQFAPERPRAHADETVVKIAGVKHYIWFIIDSETRFVIGFHLSPHRDSPQAVSLFSEAVKLGKPSAVVSDRYSAYKVPVKSIFDGAKHIRVQSFKDDISNNLIECFNKQFKAWYKTKQGFSSFESANNLISLFVFFFNFVRPHSALNGLTPAQVAGLNLSKQRKREFLLVA